MANIEARMRSLDLLESKPAQPFLPDLNRTTGVFVSAEDDHLPFISRGTEILHIIPHPFPRVWHRMEDNGEHLHMPTVRDWGKIVAAFALEWLDMMEVWYEPGEETD